MTLPPTIAIIAQGEMGAGVGRRLASQGARVLTVLAGRSPASVARAQAAGMADVAEVDLADADMILSILPPGEAMALAERLEPVLGAATTKPLYVDCNAVAPATVQSIGALVQATGAPFVDAGIIGGPPQPSGYNPVIYASGPEAQRFAALNELGLDIRVMDGPVGQASALKMCYAGLTKGMHAVGASVMLGAIEAGIAEPFRKELERSQSQMLSQFQTRMSEVFPKAYRWVAEMEEIGAFLGGGGQQLYQGAARQFERLAGDHAGAKVDEAAIGAFLRGRSD